MIDFRRILDDIEPSKDEELRVRNLSLKLMEIINRTAHDTGVNAEAVLLGSVAKNTWISNGDNEDGKDLDIDIFIKFPLTTSLDDLKVQGLELAEKCITEIDGTYEERYASHPYLTGTIEGYMVDFVPCYNIKDSSELKSAVDRTLLHTEYITANLRPDQTKEVRLLKRFMKMVGTYGSEFKVGGFSGYLCELLVIHYGSFLDVLKGVFDQWKPGFQIDLMNYGTAKLFKDPLVVVDPTDGNRNVSAALTLQKMAEFRVAADNFLENPKKSYFYPKTITYHRETLRDEFKNRQTHSIILAFPTPDIPADALHPQIQKTEKSLVKILETDDFKVMGSDYWTDENKTGIILLEMNTWHLTPFQKYSGPQVWDQGNSWKFLEKHPESWVEGDRWVTRTKRQYQDAESLIQGTLTSRGIKNLRVGKHLKKKLLEKYNLVDVLDLLIAEDADEDILKFLHCYLHKNELLIRD
ncbi:CCA tRNA nucleotidyltransferase [Methanobacterium sp.]|uniref:CCA tRNA nucleotidyltransferase n=1 Tax=Methanobacterium sp. TaxID=2164 RepID=UPI0025D41A92|nr:CCA tRNA nucleotidyltransferase [Methanobacterium sp.]MBI5459829.1 CCA tRNA nucleotidyltransferase [Methanobacterium sp.]